MHLCAVRAIVRRPGAVRFIGARLTESRGFSLIEVLVAVLIVAVGVLGIVGLQLVTMRTNSSAMLRSQATQYAYNIIDRARANPGANYVIALAAAPPAAPACDGAGANCTRQQMATYDLAGWFTDLGTLPGGDGAITLTGDVIAVTVQWNDSRDAVPVPTSATVRAQIRIVAPP